MGPPDDELGVTVPIRHQVASGDEAVLLVTDCVAYTTGFSLGLAIRKKHEPEPRQLPATGPSDEMALDLGIRFSDGREARMSGRGQSSPVIDWYRAWQEGQDLPTPPGPIIGPSSGGGGGRRWDMNYWIYPLPTEGPMTITCRWPVGGVPGGDVEVDGALIRRSGLSSDKLWSDGG